MAVYTFPPATKLTVGSPSIKIAYLYGEPRDLKVASPVFSRAVLYPRFPNIDGQVDFETNWQEGDPEVWPLNRLKVDEDGLVREAIHGNHNDNMLLECDPGLIGRTDIGRGAANKIDVLAPLTFQNRSIGLDPAFQPGGGGAAPPTTAFRAHKNSVNQTLVSGTPTKVTFGTEVYDRGDLYDPVLSRWTPPAGLVHFDAHLWFQSGLTAGGTDQIAIYKNGVAYQWQPYVLSAADGMTIGFDDVANGTDYYELWVQTAGAGVLSGNPLFTFFSAHVPSGARGDIGPQGPLGNTGPPGPTGSTGSQGVQGPIGNTGPQGSQGVQGPQGVIGPQGSTGDPGAPGSLWYSGSGAPAGGLGIINDYYLNTANGVVYRKTGASTWTITGSIQGPQGAQGIQGIQGIKGDIGSIWRNGVGAPLNSLGADGDYYLNDTNGDVYVRTSGTYAVIANMLGPQGPIGNTGPQGVQGDVGPIGPPAPVGAIASTGFRAHKNGVNQTGIGNFTLTKLTFTSETYDAGGYYDTVNSRWTPPAGLIHIDAHVFTQTGLGAGTCYLEIHKNGTLLERSLTVFGTAPGAGGMQISAEDVSNGTDYYELFVQLPTSTTVVINGAIDATYFDGHVVGGPKGDTGAQGPVGPDAPSWAQIAVGFRAHKNGVAQTGIANGALTKLTFGTEDYDQGNYYDPLVSRWTPPAGMVHIDGAYFTSAGQSAATVAGLFVYKNGVEVKRTVLTSAAIQDGGQISVDDFASGTDYYELYVSLTSASTSTIDGLAQRTWFSGHMVGGPKGADGAMGPPAPVGAIAATGFRATKVLAANQTVVAASYTKVTFPTEEYDAGGYYDSILSRWTPPAGLIHIDGRAWFTSGLTAASSIGLHIYKNGVLFKYQWMSSSQQGADGVITNCDDVANGTDYYELFAYSATAGVIYGDPTYCYFSGHSIGGPKGDTGPMGLPAPAGAIQAAGFRAHKNGVNQAHAGGWVKVTFTTEVYDSGNYYDNVLSRWVPPAGIVHIDCAIYINAVATWQLGLGLYKNGVLFQYTNNHAATTADGVLLAVDDVSNGTDFYEVFAYAPGATTVHGPILLTYFGGHVTGGPKGDKGDTGFPAPVGAIQATGFRANKNAVDQTGVASGYSKVTFGFEDYDSGGYYDVATSRWTPPSGLIHLDAAIYVSAGLTANSNLHAAIYKNGVNYKNNIAIQATGNGGCQISLDDVANGNDYYELWVGLTSAATATLTGAVAQTYFCGHCTGGPKGADGAPGPPAPVGAIASTGFRAHKNAVNQTGLANSTWTKLSFTTENYDYGSYYDAPNSRWLPPAGLVHIDGSVMLQSITTATQMALGIAKNGVVVFQSNGWAATTSDGMLIAFDDVSNGTDYYELFIWAGTAGAGIINGQVTATWFSGHLTGGPVGPMGPAAPIGAMLPTGFRAHKNAVDQTGLVGNVANKITFTTEEYDYGGFYDAANSRWIPSAGLVHIDAVVYYGSGLTAGTGTNLYVYKNGVMLKHALNMSPYTLNGIQISVDDIASGTDYYEVYEMHATSTAVASGVVTDTFFCGHCTGGPKGDNGPAAPVGAVQPTGFRAWKNGVNQTGMTSQVTTKVTCTTEEYDYGGYYDAANSRWLPPAGIVHIDAAIWAAAGVTAGSFLWAVIRKNGVDFKRGVTLATTYDGVQISVDDLASGSDYYELFINVNGTATINGTDATFFSGHVTGGPKGDTGPPPPMGAMLPIGFRAGKSVTQTGLANGNWTKLTFPVESFDLGDFYDASSSQWTPPAGIVHIDGSVLVTPVTTGGQLALCVFKNGLGINQGNSFAGTTSDGIDISIDDVASGSDFYELYVWVTGASGTVLAAQSYWSGHVTGGPKGDTGPTGAQGPPTVDLGSTVADAPLQLVSGSPNHLGVNAKFVLAPGIMAPFAGAAAPDGWILCDGRNVNRFTNAALFAAIGTIHGIGDNSTTFGIPDLRGRTIFGRDPGEATGRLTTAISGLNSGVLGAVGGDQRMQLHNHAVTDPTHNHTINDPTHVHPQSGQGNYYTITNGDAYYLDNTGGTYYVWTSSYVYLYQEDARYTGTYNSGVGTGISIQNNGAGGSQNIPPGIVMNYIIFAGV